MANAAPVLLVLLRRGNAAGTSRPKMALLSPELRSRSQEGMFSGSAPFPRHCGLGALTSSGESANLGAWAEMRNRLLGSQRM